VKPRAVKPSIDLPCAHVEVTRGAQTLQVTIDFEPFKPINTSLYLCDNKFHVEVCATLAWHARERASRIHEQQGIRHGAGSKKGRKEGRKVAPCVLVDSCKVAQCVHVDSSLVV
jgi:hypothetical protein